VATAELRAGRRWPLLALRGVTTTVAALVFAQAALAGGFRTPLLAPPPRHPVRVPRPPLTDDELDVLLGNVAALVEAGNVTAALRLMEDGLERARAGSYVELDLQYRLGTALFYEGEHRRAAALLTAAADGFRANGMAPAAEHVVECSYLAGHAYVELNDTAAALVQLRYYLHHSAYAEQTPDDERLLDTRFVIAQLLAAEDRLDEALAELRVLRPAFERRYGPESVHVRNLDRQAERLSGGR
jgi:eukaryotic-like serine/threonine-protein kinase